ncbi:uncharacterized protein LOC127529635 isoform X1 [Erpetoichthys calabaricus]|uniref:uncharacterized protein LOC127529635 isoform X1 n=1 Tax=Erpetoichthys calabaricus TaxID=27687 RepID=UPI002234A30A|nr:uncharacterized protein LOC127529635 isoform X1 [Erpetoichthys calabaricus]
MQATQLSKVSCLLLLWCAVLSISFLGMAFYVIREGSSSRIPNSGIPKVENKTDYKKDMLIGKPEGRSHQGVPLIHVTRHGKDQSQSFANQIKMEGNHIIIQKPGYYYVYAQTTFKLNKTEHHLIMQIRKQTKSYSKFVVVSNSDEKLQFDKNDNIWTLSQNTILKLGEEDRLEFKVTPEDYICNNNMPSSFYGAFKISDDF